MHVPLSNTSFIMTKQAVNGITNALAARMIFTGFALRSHSLQMSFREIAANLLAFFVLVPALIMLVVEGRTDFDTTERNIRTALIQDSGGMTQRLETWIQNRKANLLYLAEIAASRTPQQMQQALEQAKQSSSNFLRLGLMDRDATATAYSPLLDERGQNNIGKNFADRLYIQKLRKTGKPLLSEVFLS